MFSGRGDGKQKGQGVESQWFFLLLGVRMCKDRLYVNVKVVRRYVHLTSVTLALIVLGEESQRGHQDQKVSYSWGDECRLQTSSHSRHHYSDTIDKTT